MDGLPLDPDVEVPQPPPPLVALLREHVDLLPAIAVGGAIGSVARWGVARALPHDAASYPWSTLWTNVSGCLLIGLLMAYVARGAPRWVRPLLGVGVLGGFTTFSTFELDGHSLLASSHGLLAMEYGAASVALGVLATLAGLTAGRLVIDRGPSR